MSFHVQVGYTSSPPLHIPLQNIYTFRYFIGFMFIQADIYISYASSIPTKTESFFSSYEKETSLFQVGFLHHDYQVHLSISYVQVPWNYLSCSHTSKKLHRTGAWRGRVLEGLHRSRNTLFFVFVDGDLLISTLGAAKCLLSSEQQRDAKYDTRKKCFFFFFYSIFEKL